MPVFSRHWVDDHQQLDKGQLQTRGPALQIQIAIPDERAVLLAEAQQPLPGAEQGTALIDTGAAFTAIDILLLQKLGLTPISTIKVFGPTGQEEQGVFQCKLEFPGSPIPAFTHTVVGSKLTGFGHAALIGRDLLQNFLLIYNGPDGTWSLAY